MKSVEKNMRTINFDGAHLANFANIMNFYKQKQDVKKIKIKKILT
jgi:hypothetical protein